jgi:DNA (cytosine-5)-methyltransferase 1
MRELALFAGAGGGLLAGRLLGWNTVCAVEIEEYCRRVLLQRQRDGILPRFPIWDDVRTFDGRPWRSKIDIISGGFPCQDVSAAGKGAGLAGERSGLWFEMLRVIDEVRPPFVFAENSPNLRTRGLGTVIEGLTGLGYGVRWCVLGARHVGAPHRRDRMWLLAANMQSWGRGEGWSRRSKASNARETIPLRAFQVTNRASENDRFRYCPNPKCEDIWEQPRGVCRTCGAKTLQPRLSNRWSMAELSRMDDGMANRMDRVTATGNGQVPAVATLAWSVLTRRSERSKPRKRRRDGRERI